ncbi:hypothetical protein BMS3Abin09_01148 [bacterium BMS3Abin09]|nr:hypothetical protein BMS3Abin09_01148 [bacterium BMS3Abin09]
MPCPYILNVSIAFSMSSGTGAVNSIISPVTGCLNLMVYAWSICLLKGMVILPILREVFLP